MTVLHGRLRRTSGISFAECAGTWTVGEPAGVAGRPPRRSTVVDCQPAGRAVRWDGTNRDDVEAVTGRLTAVSMACETSLLVDAWGAATVCPVGAWVVVAGDRIRVLSQREFTSKFKFSRAKEAAA